MPNRCLVTALVSVALSACSVGGKPETDPVGTHPAGIETSILTLSGPEYRGELLAAEDSALVLLVDSRIVRVANAQVKRVTFEKMGESLSDKQWRELTAKPSAFDRVRLRSRYPHGISPDLETRLLAAYRAPAIEEVR